MNDVTTTSGRPSRAAARRGAVRRALRGTWSDPVGRVGLVTVAVLGVLVVAPLTGLVATTLRPEGLDAWADVLASPLSRNLFYEPLLHSLFLGVLTALGSTLLGGGLAWLTVMTDMPLRRTVTLLASIPFALPSFALALAWETVFRNDLVGGRVGVLQDLGLSIPDWLAWGPLPISLTLVAHYYSLSFLLVAAALANIGGDVIAAGEMTGASRSRIMRSITLPIIAPAVVGGGLLAFAEGVSNFASPALLGLPVRYQTVSTRLYGAIQTGEVARGYVLSILLITVAAVVLFASTRVSGGRRSYATITGKGGQRQRVRLGRWRRPMLGLALAAGTATTILPGLVLLASSFSRRTNSLTGGFTTHFWVGRSDPSIAQGQRGVLRNPQLLDAALNTVTLGLCVAAVAIVIGLAAAYAASRRPHAKGMTTTLNGLTFVPFLVPGIALGAAFIAQFGRPVGPLPTLYGTFAILVLAGAVASLPFAAQAGRSALAQVAGDLEESATMTGAGLGRRLARIVLPLASRGLVAGAVLVFVTTVRDLSLMVLLVTPATPLLAVETFRYASEGFAQFANAVTVIIAVISVGATVAARRLEGGARPWERR